jgi:hypothetical protein
MSTTPPDNAAPPTTSDDPPIFVDWAEERAYRAGASMGTLPENAASLVPVFVYRNRDDDDRGPDQLHFCRPCGGWYGVPHTNSHCQKRTADELFNRHLSCACRFCRERALKPVQGTYGFFPTDPKWQP